MAAGEADGGDGVRFGQSFQRVGMYARPAPEAFDIGMALLRNSRLRRDGPLPH